MQSNIGKLKHLLANANLPFEWSAEGFQFDGYLCPEYMAAALNAFPYLLAISEAVCLWEGAEDMPEIADAEIEMAEALAAFNAAKIGSDQ